MAYLSDHLRELTDYERGFVLAYVAGGGRVRAARAAGYLGGPNCLRATAVDLLARSDIRRAIADLRLIQAEVESVTVESLSAYLLALMANLAEPAGARVSAVQTVARLHGLLVDRQQVTGQIDHALLPGPPRDPGELRALLAEIRATRALPARTEPLDGAYRELEPTTQPDSAVSSPSGCPDTVADAADTVDSS